MPNFIARSFLKHLKKEQEEALIQDQSVNDGIANLHEEQALKIHKEETDAINDKRDQEKAVA